MFDQSDTELLDSIFKDYKKNTKRVYLRHISDFFKYFNLKKLNQLSKIDADTLNNYILNKNLDRRSGIGYQIASSIRFLEKKLTKLDILKEENLEFQKFTRRETKFTGNNIISVEKFNSAFQNHHAQSGKYYIKDFEYAGEIRRRNLIITILIYTCGLQSTEISGARWANLKKIKDRYYLKTKRDHESKFFYYEIIPYLYTQLLESKKNLDMIRIHSPFLVCSFGRRSKAKALTTKAINTSIREFFEETDENISPLQIRNFSNFCKINSIQVNNDIYVGEHFIRYECAECHKESEFVINNICQKCQTEDLVISKKIVGYVYFIKTVNNDFIKIGITKTDIQRRFSNIQSGNMYKLKLLGFLPSENPKKLEKKIHQYFLKFKMQGEWFNITERRLFDALDELNLSKKLQLKLEN